MQPSPVPLTYRVVMWLVTPVVRWWGRLQVVGLDLLPRAGATVLMVNHDSAWDPLAVGLAAVQRRQILALARSSLWELGPLSWVLDHMGQIPIDRDTVDTSAVAAAITALQDGGCLGVFPEGTVSRGRPLRPRGGAGWLALGVPQTRVLCVAVTGTVDVVRFPKRPRIRVEFFEPPGGQPQPGERPTAITRRAMAEVRARAPYAVPSRGRKAERFRRLALEDAGIDTDTER